LAECKKKKQISPLGTRFYGGLYDAYSFHKDRLIMDPGYQTYEAQMSSKRRTGGDQASVSFENTLQL
jgi:hypothetical protein